jgi:hypothetical protein
MFSQRGGADESMPTLTPAQISYKDIRTVSSKGKYVKVVMSNILGNSFIPTATGVTQIQFKIPYNSVFNLARSKLAYQISLPAQGAGNYTWCTQDCFNLGNQLVTFETGNGLQLLNLPEPQKYSSILGKLNQKFTDYITNDFTEKPYSNAAFASYLNGSPAAAPANPTANPTCQNVAISVPYFETQYLTVSAANNILFDSNYAKLGNLFPNTILALDKDVYFGQNDVYLKITSTGYNQFAWMGTSATNPTTGAATLGTAPTGATGIVGIYLYLWVEQDPIIIDRIVNQFNSNGLKLTIDFPVVSKTTTNASTNQSLVIPFVPANGKYLKKVYHTIWNATESLSTLMDCNNQSGAKLTSYVTYLDSTRLQDDIIVCATPAAGTIGLSDWLWNEQQCRNSAIFSSAIYQKNWFHCDDFTDPSLLKDPQPAPAQNLINGLPMERGIQWQFSGTFASATSYIHDNFAIFIREVLISANGIQFI